MESNYFALPHTGAPNINKTIWKLKMPLKVKIFLWYLRRGVVLIKDNPAKRKWKGSKIFFLPQRRNDKTFIF